MNLPLTRAAQTRAELLSLARDFAALADQIALDTTEGAYVCALGHSVLALDSICKLKVRLERAAQDQRN